MYYTYGPMGGNHFGWEIFMGALWLIFFAILAVAVVRLLMHHDVYKGSGQLDKGSPQDIVKKRYALGEINKAEYEQLLKDLK